MSAEKEKERERKARGILRKALQRRRERTNGHQPSRLEKPKEKG